MNLNKERWINLENLPKYETRYHNGLINWPKSIGYKIEFYYRGIEGEFLITDYYSRREKNRNRFYLKVQYKDNAPVEITIDNIYRCRLGTILEYYIFPYEFKVGEVINDLEILEQTHISTKNKKKYRAYKYLCKNCGHIGKAYAQEMETKRCPKCGDGISYGEKFMYAVLSYAGYDFETQHVFEWSKGENGLKGMKKYDFYIPSENCIIEMHGIQHYPDEGHDFSYFQGVKSEDEVENDKLKKEMAIKNGILEERYITIDCKKSEFEYIKNSILDNTQFMNIFDVKDFDREYIEVITMTNFRKRAIELYKQGYYINDIVQETKISKKTIMRFLKESADFYGYTYICDKDRLENEKKQNILELFKKGDSRKTISQKTGVCYSSINKILREYKEVGKCEYKTQSDIKNENCIKAAELFNFGLSEKEIAKEMQVDDTTVVKYLIEARGAGFCDIYLSSTEKFNKKIEDSCKLYNEGLTPREIEKKLKLKKDQIYNYLIKGKEMGLCDYKRPDEIREERMKVVCELYNSGLKVMEICKKLNLDKGTVGRDLKRSDEKGLCVYIKHRKI